jgi:acyl-CoA thioester hydrolase
MRPAAVWREPVQDAWIDYNGHLSEPYYVLVFGHATDAVMDAVGMGPAYRERTRASLFTVEAHVRYLDQVTAGAVLEVRSSVIGQADRKLLLWHEMWCDGRLRATEEVLGVHVDTVSGRATALPPVVAAEAARLLQPAPEQAGRRVAL